MWGDLLLLRCMVPERGVGLPKTSPNIVCRHLAMSRISIVKFLFQINVVHTLFRTVYFPFSALKLLDEFYVVAH